jgi:hypothetical protein
MRSAQNETFEAADLAQFATPKFLPKASWRSRALTGCATRNSAARTRDGGLVAIATWLRGRRRRAAINPRPVAAGPTSPYDMPFRAGRGWPVLKPARGRGLSDPLGSRLRGLRVQVFSARGACLPWAWFRRGLRSQVTVDTGRRGLLERSSANAHEDDGPDGPVRESKHHLFRRA